MKPFTFQFTPDEINIIMQGLGELPAKMSLRLIGKIHNAVDEQKKALPETAGAPQAATLKARREARRHLSGNGASAPADQPPSAL